MPLDTKELYRSPNGDRWSLVRDPASGRVSVRHEPNAASGGRASDTGVGAFRVRRRHRPEPQELPRLSGAVAAACPSRT